MDIVENADSIASYLAGFDEESYALDKRTIDATERCLERIAEAAVTIGAEAMRSIAPDVPFERVRGLGNILRHAYDEIDLGLLFGILTSEVPSLADAARTALDN